MSSEFVHAILEDQSYFLPLQSSCTKCSFSVTWVEAVYDVLCHRVTSVRYFREERGRDSSHHPPCLPLVLKKELRHSNVSFYLIEICFKNMINYIHSCMLSIQIHIQNIYNSKHPPVTFDAWQ